MTFEDTLARWLPKQRWFSGRDMLVRELAVQADTLLAAGQPEFRHLIVSISQGSRISRYQLIVGLAAQLPPALSGAVIGPAAGGMTAYDALHDPRLGSVLVQGIAGERTAGPVHFAREPGALLGSLPASRVLTGEQSNTSLVYGDCAILKVLRKVFPGTNPDLEVAGALARLGSRRIAPPFGWIETELDGEPALLAVLSRYLPNATDGWSLALADLERLYARQGAYGQEYLTTPLASGPAPMQRSATASGFAAEAFALGAATAELHADMAAAFGVSQLAPREVQALATLMTQRLEQATAEVPELTRYEDKARAAYRDVAALTSPVTVQRVHGDYHLGQVMRTPEGWVALDFEGEPATPLAQRRAASTPLRDVAGMLRSFDYAARHQLVGHPEAARLAGTADEWVQRCQEEFCAGYGDAGGTDPKAKTALLRALMLDKAVYEVIYESRHRPSWLPIPLESIAAA